MDIFPEIKVEDIKELGQLEQKLLELGYETIAGVDESGRGAWAGPLIAAAVIIPCDLKIPNLKECKQKTPLAREKLYEFIVNNCYFSVAAISVEKIELLGLQKANLIALKEAIEKLPVKPHLVLSDGYSLPDLKFPQKALVKGDIISASIAAASIISKVTRDRIMVKLGCKFPCYKFDSNKGYGTKQHIEAINKFGPAKIHRKNFAPIKQAIIK
ncbi:MAG: ribonuclease HII [Candidatus Subteraquimicrobiales bacterium]|nr:ribonuclease HII [Candidatus Subteraquimicrobiales bacterium]